MRHETGLSGVRSLLRGLTILDVLADSPDGLVCLADIAERAGLSASTAHRLLTTLVERGYAGREPGSKGYVIGHRMIRFSSAVKRRTAQLRRLVRPHLEAITAETGETSNLVVLDGQSVVYVDQVEGTRALRMVPGIGAIFPAHTSASAKAILAYQIDGTGLDDIFGAAPLVRYAARTLIDRRDFESGLRHVVTRGFAVEESELAEGASCIAAAIRGRSGVAVGAISVPGPTHRVLVPAPDRLGALLGRHALSVSHALGFRQLVRAAV